MFVVVATGAGATIAFVGHSQHVAIITAITAAVSFFLEFHEPQGKLARYNSVVIQLESLLSWWNSLTAIEKAGKSNMQALVFGVEDFAVSDLKVAYSMAALYSIVCLQSWSVTAAPSDANASKINGDAGGSEKKEGTS